MRISFVGKVEPMRGVCWRSAAARRPIRRSPDCLTNAFGLHAWARSRLRTAAEVALAASDTILDSHFYTCRRAPPLMPDPRYQRRTAIGPVTGSGTGSLTRGSDIVRPLVNTCCVQRDPSHQRDPYRRVGSAYQAPGIVGASVSRTTTCSTGPVLGAASSSGTPWPSRNAPYRSNFRCLLIISIVWTVSNPLAVALPD